MADGNDFFNVLVWPAVEKLLQPAEGDRLLDVACGNGVTFNQRHFGVVPLQFGIEVLTSAVALRRIK